MASRINGQFDDPSAADATASHALAASAASGTATPRRARAPFRRRVEALLALADVRIDGDRPHDLRVHDARLYRRLLAEGSLGLGEAYMDGWWDAGSVDGLLAHLLAAKLEERVRGWAFAWDALHAKLLNRQSRRRAFVVGERHYDLGVDLYRAMLGRRLVYSCGYWRRAGDLDAAQEAKLRLCCDKLQLKPGMRLLDIGCGWGEALKFAAENYGVSGVGVTVSAGQADYARTLCRGLPVEIRLQDYRDIEGSFDAIVSIGMFEHVGVRNYPAFFAVADRCLAPDGLLLLHTIGANVSTDRTDPWIHRHIFPNSMLPSAQQIAAAGEGVFVMEDWHGFGPDYDRTLQAWRDNIEAAWDRLPARYDERFRRMWRYYLACSMASFRVRRIQLWQIVFSRGRRGGYVAPR